MFSLSACSRGREMHFKGLLWGFNPPQPSSSLATKWHPSSVFGCVRRVLRRREYGKRFQWLDGQVSCCQLPGWGWLGCACLHAALSQNSAQAVPCLHLSLSPVYLDIVDSQIIPVLKKCHSFCMKELLMPTDDSPLGRSELFCMPGEEKGLFHLRSDRGVTWEVRGGNKNILADSGFKDPVVLRVRKRHIFGKYPSYQSVANTYLLLAILFPFFWQKNLQVSWVKIR